MTIHENSIEESEINELCNPKLKEGIRLYSEKNWDNALIEFLSIDSSGFSNEDKSEIAYYLGLCYTKLQRYEEALSYLEQVVTTSENFLRVFQCRMTLAYIYVITDRVKMAEYELTRLQNMGMESPLLFNTLAYTAWVQKQYLRACELYEKVLEIDSENATALNSMGYILADTGIDIKKAVKFCKKAVDYNPNNPAYLDSLGWACYKSGETQEAVKILRRALEIAPNEKEIQKHFNTVSGMSHSFSDEEPKDKGRVTA